MFLMATFHKLVSITECIKDKFIFNWRKIALQCCVGFCHTTMRISHNYTSSEKTMVPHSSTLAWKIPWMEEPGGLQSMGSRRVGYD